MLLKDIFISLEDKNTKRVLLFKSEIVGRIEAEEEWYEIDDSKNTLIPAREKKKQEEEQ